MRCKALDGTAMVMGRRVALRQSHDLKIDGEVNQPANITIARKKTMCSATFLAQDICQNLMPSFSIILEIAQTLNHPQAQSINICFLNSRAKFALGFRPTEEREEASPPDPPSPRSPPPPEEAERIISTLLPK